MRYEAWKEHTMAATTSTQPVLKLTPSRLRDYLVCGRKFEQQHLRLHTAENGAATAPRPQETASMSFGNSLHAVLDALHKVPSEASDVPTQTDKVADLLPLHWRSNGYTDKESEDAAFLEASSVLKYYVRSPHVPSGTLLGTELYLSCHTSVAHRRV